MEIFIDKKGTKLIPPEGTTRDTPIPMPQGGGTMEERYPCLGTCQRPGERPRLASEMAINILQVTITSIWAFCRGIDRGISFPREVETYGQLEDHFTHLMG